MLIQIKMNKDAKLPRSRTKHSFISPKTSSDQQCQLVLKVAAFFPKHIFSVVRLAVIINEVTTKHYFFHSACQRVNH